MRIDLLSASDSELRSLPGMGIKRASNIIRLREKYGYISKELFSIAFGGPIMKTLEDLVIFLHSPYGSDDDLIITF